MFARTVCLAVAGALAAVFFSRTCAAEHEELAHIPPQTLSIVRLRSADGVKEDSEKFARALFAEAKRYFPKDAELPSEDELDDAIAGDFADLSGWSDLFDADKVAACDPSHPCYALLIISEHPDDAEDFTVKLAFLARCKDVPRLLRVCLAAKEGDAVETQERDDGFVAARYGDHTCYFRLRDDWIVFTDEEACLAPLRTAAGDAESSILPHFDEAARNALLSGDVSMAVNFGLLLDQPSVKQAFAEGREHAGELLDEFQPQFDKVDWASFHVEREWVEKTIRQAIDTALEVAAEPRWFAGHIDLGADGVGGLGVVTFKPDGHVDAVLKTRRPIALDLLNGLPAGRSAYLGWKCDDGLTKFLLDLHRLYARTVRERGKVAALERYLQAQRSQTAIAIDPPARANWGVRVLRLEQAKRPEAVRQHEKRQAHQNDPKEKRVAYEERQERYGEQPVDVMIEEAVKESDGEEEPEDLNAYLEQMLTALTGTYRETWNFVRDDLYIAGGGYDWNGFRDELDLLKTNRTPTGEDRAFRETRGRLDADANVVMLVNLPHLVVGLLCAAPDVLVADDPALEALRRAALEKPRSYSGWSVAFHKGHVRGRFFAPVEQFAFLGAAGEGKEQKQEKDEQEQKQGAEVPPSLRGVYSLPTVPQRTLSLPENAAPPEGDAQRAPPVAPSEPPGPESSERLRQLLDEWEKLWFLDMPDHEMPFRTHGGII